MEKELYTCEMRAILNGCCVDVEASSLEEAKQKLQEGKFTIHFDTGELIDWSVQTELKKDQ